MITVTDISKSYGDRNLFSNLSVNIISGQRIGLVGSNGTGKSTLLDIIFGEKSPDSGNIVKQRNLSVGYLTQNAISPSDQTLIDQTLEESESIINLRDQISSKYQILSKESHKKTQQELLKEIGNLETELEMSGEIFDEHQAKEILSGLGFNPIDFDKPLNEFSGGWLMRAALAKMLLKKPDVLLLDEPTNHLDLFSNLWFEKYLLSFKGGVVITSHDRTFLNKITTMILAIESDEIISFKGNYDTYLDFRERNLEIKHAAAKRQDREIQRQMKFVQKFRSKARRATQVQSRLKQLQKIEQIVLPRTTTRVHYSFPEPQRSGVKAIALNHLNKSYGKHKVYENLNIEISRGDKVALVGPNGAGKSTLLKIMAGVLEFDSGERKLGSNVKTSYYSQHLLDQLNQKNSLLEELLSVAPTESEQNLRRILGGFLFSGNDVEKPISVTSGGEKARIAIAKLLLQQSNMIFMDEPTNHLDIISREILADALSDYKGTICFITHDRTLINQVANKIIDVTGGKPRILEGNLQDYDFETNPIPPFANSQSNKSKIKPKSKSATKKSKLNLSKLNSDLKNVRSSIKSVDGKISDISLKLTDLEKFFSNPLEFDDKINFSDSSKEYQLLKIKEQDLTKMWEHLTVQEEEILKNIDNFGNEKL
ncbi:MAG: ATP-binding cassette domain-containing protein [SAR202 cluster bacterium]|nr:ATP-binding cassette domain-containing protein [SAR202 cluster bacterium]